MENLLDTKIEQAIEIRDHYGTLIKEGQLELSLIRNMF